MGGGSDGGAGGGTHGGVGDGDGSGVDGGSNGGLVGELIARSRTQLEGCGRVERPERLWEELCYCVGTPYSI